MQMQEARLFFTTCICACHGRSVPAALGPALVGNLGRLTSSQDILAFFETLRRDFGGGASFAVQQPANFEGTGKEVQELVQAVLCKSQLARCKPRSTVLNTKEWRDSDRDHQEHKHKRSCIHSFCSSTSNMTWAENARTPLPTNVRIGSKDRARNAFPTPPPKQSIRPKPSHFNGSAWGRNSNRLALHMHTLVGQAMSQISDGSEKGRISAT